MLARAYTPLSDFKFFPSCIALVLSTSVSVQAANIAYSYDAAGRLLTVRYSDGQKADFAYDETGNITGQTVVGRAVTVPLLQLLLETESRGSGYSSVLIR